MTCEVQFMQSGAKKLLGEDFKFEFKSGILSSELIATQRWDLGVVKLQCEYRLCAHKLEKASWGLEGKQKQTIVFLYIHILAS